MLMTIGEGVRGIICDCVPTNQYLQLPGEVFGHSNPWLNLLLRSDRDLIILYNEDWAVLRTTERPKRPISEEPLYQEKLHRYEDRKTQLQTQSGCGNVVELPSRLFWNIQERPNDTTEIPRNRRPYRVLLMRTSTEVYLEIYSIDYDYLGSRMYPIDPCKLLPNANQALLGFLIRNNAPHERKMEYLSDYHPQERRELIPTIQIKFVASNCEIHLVYPDGEHMEAFVVLPDGRIVKLKEAFNKFDKPVKFKYVPYYSPDMSSALKDRNYAVVFKSRFSVEGVRFCHTIRTGRVMHFRKSTSIRRLVKI